MTVQVVSEDVFSLRAGTDCGAFYTGLCVRKQTIWVPIRSDTNQAVQSQKMVKGLKFCIQAEEGLYYPCSENKGGYRKLICPFVFAPAFCRFSYAVAHIMFIFQYPTVCCCFFFFFAYYGILQCIGELSCPCLKMGHDHPKVRIYINIVELGSDVTYQFPDTRSLGSSEDF